MDLTLDFRFPHSTAESVEVYGSWDNYAHGFALTADKNEVSWNGAVKVRISTAIQPGRVFLQRYWYYYMLDGIKTSYDDELKQPKEESQEEKSGWSTSSESCSDESTGFQCTCERYGITRAGDRVKLDCGGTKCGLCDDDSSESGQDDV
ncbi:hypothetical protein DL98DRAFT_621291 [Cadophora sp. DSE1049]|nr:hypothetical protein DL98DRAFT_621291 [Cadophora sp. DSE1049]